MSAKENLKRETKTLDQRLTALDKITDPVTKNLTYDIIMKNHYIAKLEARIEELTK